MFEIVEAWTVEALGLKQFVWKPGLWPSKKV